MKAIIGHTGFVGSNLIKRMKFDHMYNSKNIDLISNFKYNLIVCAGIPSAKWYANQNPKEDMKNIKQLINNLIQTRCDNLILISSIDVFQKTFDNPGLEKCVLSHHSYGYNRYYAEIELKNHFKNKLTIVRLPALFGENLKKNSLFDLMNNKFYKKLNLCDTYQWYDIKDLSDDIEFIFKSNVSEINLFGEPIAMKEIVDDFFKINIDDMFYDCERAIKYDLKVGIDYPQDYWIYKDETLEKLKKFLHG